MTIKTLIDKAAEKVGTRYKLAKLLGVTPSRIYDWEEERTVCSAADRARLAGMAGEDAVQELVRATLEKTAGTKRGEQLERLLGKWSHQTGAVVNSVLLSLVSLSFGLMNFDLLRCIKRSQTDRRYLFC